MKFRMMLSALLLAAGLVCVSGCKGGKKVAAKAGEPTTPTEVAGAFFKAVVEGREADAVKLCTGKNVEKDVKEAVSDLQKKAQADPKSKAAIEFNALKNAKFADEEIKGGKATVNMVVTIEIDGEKNVNKVSFILKQVEGKWKLDADAMDAKKPQR